MLATGQRGGDMGLDDRDYMRDPSRGGRLKGLDEFPTSRRPTRRPGLSAILNATIETQAGALVFGLIGVVLSSPLPHLLIDAAHRGTTTNPYANSFGSAYAATAYMMLPWVHAFGFLLMGTAAATLLIRGQRPAFRVRLRTPAENNMAAAALIAALLVEAAWNPPHLAPGRREMADAERVIGSQANEDLPHQSAVGTTFPPNGTIRWGAEEPIGGDLGTLDIWDVTGSSDDKVVAIRNGLVMSMPGVAAPRYAIVYIRAGQRVSLSLPKNRPYHITALSGPKWMGPEALFGPQGTTVDFGQVILTGDQHQVIAMGAPDQTASVVPADRF